jgi:transaldolase
MELVQQIRTVYDNFGLKTEIIVAAVRGIPHLLEAALIGADITTMGTAIFDKLLVHPQTDQGLEEFLESWKKVPQEEPAGARS